MRKIHWILLLATLLVACSKPKWPSQDYIAEYNYQEVDRPAGLSTDTIFPMYPNGVKGIAEVIISNVRYPDSYSNGIRGQVVIDYVIGQDGYVSQIEVSKSVDPDLDKEAIRLIKLLKRWIPGRVNGKFVKFLFSQPITF